MTMTLSQKRSSLTATEQPATGQYSATGFEALFQEHWERLCRVLYHLTYDWAEAEDLALEAFLQLYQRPPAHQENLGGWLYRVGTNLGLNALRARKRRQYYETQAGPILLEHSQPGNPADALEQEQERQRVRTALSNLKPRSAQALLLRHNGMSYREIAAALEVSPASVGTLLARAEKEFEEQYDMGNL